MRGLYIHIPFCKKRCYYCDFSSTTVDTPESHQQFFGALQKQIQFSRDQYGELSFDTLYIGGGTPSRLSIEEMAKIFELVQASFKIATAAEITCEVNPGDVTQEKAEAYRRLGINRISLGAQAFQDSILQSIGRPHDVQAVFDAVKIFRDTGFKNISLDLIIRLPGQTFENVRESLDEILKISPEQVTVYDLDIHKKTAFGVSQARGKLKLPDPELHEEMFELVKKILGGAGYRHYELMTFAKPGFESKHNLIYWHNEEYLGLGPSAVSYFNGVRFELAHDVRKYVEKCLKNDFRPDVEDVLTDEQKQTETLLTGLRLSEGVDLNLLRLIQPKLDRTFSEWLENGLIEIHDGRVFLTAQGRKLNEMVLSDLAGLVSGAKPLDAPNKV